MTVLLMHYLCVITLKSKIYKMATKTYYPQLFRCTNPDCKHSEKIYIWSDELTPETFKPCPKCNDKEAMKPEFEEIGQGPAYITTAGNNKQMSPSQLAARKARNKAKFKTDGMAQM